VLFRGLLRLSHCLFGNHEKFWFAVFGQGACKAGELDKEHCEKFLKEPREGSGDINKLLFFE